MKGKKLQVLFGFFISLLATKAFSAISVNEQDTLGGDETPVPMSAVPIPSQVQSDFTKIYPAFHAWGLVGRYDTVKGQILWPFSGNNYDSVFYGAIEGSFANKDTGWMGGAGIGYRKIINDTYLLGGYVLVDYNDSPAKHHFYVANPGLEFLGDSWDVRGNFYVPLNSNRRWYNGEYWGEDLGIYHYVISSGHQQFDNKFRWIEFTGTGLDGEIGSKIPGCFGLKGYVGGYHYFMNQGDSITGFEARLEFPIKRCITLDVRGTTDNVQHNCIIGGVRLSLGGVPADGCSTNVNVRLLDPIEHDMADFGKGCGIPIRNQFLNEGKSTLRRDHVWFFEPGSIAHNAITGDGTAEHPYSGINQAIINSIVTQPAGSNAQLFFTSGEYNLGGRLQLPNGFSMVGRSDDFSHSAYGAVFDGGIDLFVGNNNLQYLILHNDGTQPVGINIVNAYNVNIDNLIIGSPDDTSKDFATGIYLNAAKNVNISNTKIYAAASGIQSFGLFADNGSLLNILSNNFITSSQGASYVSTGGLFANAGSTVNIYGSGNTLAAISNVGITYAVVLSNSVLNIYGCNNQINSSSSSTDDGSSGIGLLNSSTLNIFGDNNSINVNSGWYSFGIEAMWPNSTVNISGSNTIINANGNFGSIGLFDGGSLNTIKITGPTVFNVGSAANPSSAIGIELASSDPAVYSQARLDVRNTKFNVNSATPGEAWGIHSIIPITNPDLTRLKDSGNSFSANLDSAHQVGGP